MQTVRTSIRKGMPMQIVKFLAIVTVAVMTTACGTSSGGGWIPSAADPAQKANFGFQYSCDSSTNRIHGHLVYHDHGTGHKAIVSIDQPVPSAVSCTTFLTGVTSACGVVTNGSGGVSANDVVLVATADGKPAATTDALAIVLFSSNSTSTNLCNSAIQTCAAESTLEDFLQCLSNNNVGTPYYVNSGSLGGGNITWTE